MKGIDAVACFILGFCVARLPEWLPYGRAISGAILVVVSISGLVSDLRRRP